MDKNWDIVTIENKLKIIVQKKMKTLYKFEKEKSLVSRLSMLDFSCGNTVAAVCIPAKGCKKVVVRKVRR